MQLERVHHATILQWNGEHVQRGRKKFSALVRRTESLV